MSDPTTILLISDSPPDAIQRALRDAGFALRCVSSLGEALGWFVRDEIALVLRELAGDDDLERLQALHTQTEAAGVPILAITGPQGGDWAARVFGAGADDVLRRPFADAELIARVRNLLRARGNLLALARRERDLSVVLELTHTLASSLDLRDILRTVVIRLAEVTHVDRCSIVITREDEQVIVATSDGDQVLDLPLDLGRFPEIIQAIQTGESVVIDDVSSHPIHEVLRPDSNGQRSSLALVPLPIEGRGVLFLRSSQPGLLGKKVLSVARTVANATGIALRNARLLEGLREQTQQISKARQEAEHRLRTTQRFAKFFEHAADGIAVFQIDGSMLFANPRAIEICGVSSAPLDRLTIEDFWLDEDRPMLEQLRDGFRAGVYPHGIDMRLRRLDGPIITISANFSILHEENAILASFRDVTVERAIERELRNTKSFLESVIESSADGIISADLQGSISLFNRAAERCYGYASADVVGKINVEALYPPGVAREIMRLVRANDGLLEGHRTDVIARDGERIPVSVSVALIHEGGRVTGSVGVFTDLRDRLQIESRLIAAQEELKLRERHSLIAELAGAAAHELNQPLTSIMGYAELLKRRIGRESPGYGAAEVVLNEAERMAEIVRKIGTITRYETKTYVGQTKILDLDRASSDLSEPPPPSSPRSGS